MNNKILTVTTADLGGKSQNTKLIFRLSFSHLLFSIVLITICLVIKYWQVFQSLNTHLLGGSGLDAGLYYYLFNYIKDSFWETGFNASFYFPYQGTLAWSDNFILPGMFSHLLNLFGISVIAQYNLTLLLAIFLNGWLSFVLAFRVSGLYWISLSSGLCVLFLSVLSENTGHPQLLFFFWIPLTLINLYAFAVTAGFKSLFLAIVCCLLAFFCSLYYAIFAALLVLLFLVFTIVLRPALFTKLNIFKTLLVLLTGLASGLALAWPYLESRKLFGTRQLYETFYLSANLTDFLSASKTSLTYHWTANQAALEAGLFPGITLLLMTVFAIYQLYKIKSLKKYILLSLFSLSSALFLANHESYLIRSIAALLLWVSLISFAFMTFTLGRQERQLGYCKLSNRSLISFILGSILVFITLALGPLANPAVDEIAISPFTLLYYLFPGFSSLRSSYRFAIPAIWLLVMLLPFMLAYLQSFKSSKLRLVSWVLPLFIILENWNTSFPLEELPNNNLTNLDIGAIKTNKAILVLPLQQYNKENSFIEPFSYAKYNVEAMLWSLQLKAKNLKLINGYSGHLPRLQQRLLENVKSFPGKAALKYLSSFPNLEYIVFNGTSLPNFNSEIFESSVGQYSELKILTKAENTYLIKFQPINIIQTEKTLFVANTDSGALSMQLKAANAKTPEQNDPCQIGINLVTEYGIQELSIFDLPQDDQYHSYQVKIPQKNRSQKPHTISLINACSGLITLANRQLL